MYIGREENPYGGLPQLVRRGRGSWRICALSAVAPLPSPKGAWDGLNRIRWPVNLTSVSRFCVVKSGWPVFRAAQGVSALLADVAAVGVGLPMTCARWWGGPARVTVHERGETEKRNMDGQEGWMDRRPWWSARDRAVRRRDAGRGGVRTAARSRFIDLPCPVNDINRAQERHEWCTREAWMVHKSDMNGAQ